VRGAAVAAVLSAGLVTLGALPASAATLPPLPTPTNLKALHVSDTAADLDWNGSGLTAGDVVQQLSGGSWHKYADNTYGFLALTGLTPGATYTFRVYSPALEGLGYSDSAPSAPLSFTTLSAPDSVPPSKPPKPDFSSISTTAMNVSWGQATDNVQVTGYYLQQLVGGAWTTIRTVDAYSTFQTVWGLSPATTYTFAVIAFDARGNVSPRSDPGSATTLATTPYPSCTVQLTSFNNGFSVYVTIANTTTAALNNWTVAFTLPASVSVSSIFGGYLNRTATGGTITPASYNTTIGPGGGAFVGFSGYANPITPPSGFTLNGSPCTGA